MLEAPPGAGKTTQVPLALLAAPWLQGKILMLEPRRIAARSAASFMATQLGEEVGQRVGYRIRFEAKVSAQTRIEVVTEGILTRMLQDDPMLTDVAAVLFDEFHERHLHSDLGLALCLEIQSGLRPDLRLLVMSATLDGERVSRYLDAPRLTAEGRSFPVQIDYVPARAQENLSFQVKRGVQLALAQTQGDVLCFLPGKAEIDQVQKLLHDVDAEVDALHGELGIDEQSRLLRPGSRRRVVLATNVAESSVTLPGVCAVVDSGLAREPSFDAGSGMSRLQTVTIAQSSATQRAGRAGRVAPGRCYRLWPESQRLEPSARPELHRIELSAFALELKTWGNTELRLLDAPPPGTWAQALSLLRLLGAIDSDGRLIEHGRTLLSLGAHPRLANAMLRASPQWRALACDIAAVLEARDPMRGEARRSDDLRIRVQALNAWRRGGQRDQVDRNLMSSIDQAARQWRRRLRIDSEVSGDIGSHDVGALLAFAYPDRIARQDPANPRRYQMANGRGAQLLHESALFGSPWIVIAEIRFDERDSLIQRAAPIDIADLEKQFPEQFQTQRTLAFNRDTKAVEANEERRFADIVLSRRHVPTPRDAATANLLLEGLLQSGLGSLPWSEGLREWQARAQGLREWCPELQLPDVGDESLAATAIEWLLPALQGKTRSTDLDEATFAEALRSHLDYAQRRQVDEHAPREIVVPSGMTRKLSYTRGEAPVLAVKLQELFGLADTPRIAKGRVPVLLHLLSPGQKPVQVTQDLKGFWERTYPDVKKELKGRYPRHPWPDDPWTATATHRAKPRGT